MVKNLILLVALIMVAASFQAHERSEINLHDERSHQHLGEQHEEREKKEVKQAKSF